MQKVINLMAVLSFLGTAGIIGGGTYVYLSRAEITENVKSQITTAITEALPGMLSGSIPELPKTTGGVVGGAAPGGMSIPGL
jgi:hypothetical protein